MKRNIALVAYESDDENDTEGSVAEGSNAKPPLKRRTLPKVHPALTLAVPIDNPSLHQGRVRTTPHVEGQYAAYVYLPVSLDDNQTLRSLMDRVLLYAKELEPALLSSCATSENGQRVLHMSLTRTIYLRSHQREDLRRAVKTLASDSEPYIASFSTISCLENDERTRTFLTFELGAGSQQTEKLSRAFHPVLRILRQELYYTEPRFHVSIAWAPLSRPPNGQSTTSPQILPSGPSKAGSEPLNSSSTSSIACLSQSVVTELNARFGKELAGMRNGAFVVDRVCTRIGKDISVWKLGQQKHS